MKGSLVLEGNEPNIDILKRIYGDLIASYIHKESITINTDEIEAILDVMDEVIGID